MTLAAVQLPPNVKLMTMTSNYAELFEGGTMLRFAHLYSVDEHPTLSRPVNVSIKALFAKGEVVWATSSAWLQKIYFLKDSPQAFLVELSMALTAVVYAPGDSPRLGFMYIVHRGVALYRAKVTTSPKPNPQA